MAAEFKIGRLRYNWAGAWSSGTVYARDSVIQYQGRAYVCLVPNTAGTNFYNDLYASPYPYWLQMTEGHTFLGPWTTNTVYSLNNLVIFGGSVYACTTPHTSSVFATDAGNWIAYVQTQSWQGIWAPNTVYGVGELIKYGGIVYECTVPHVSAATLTLGLEANQSNWTVFYNGVNYLGSWNAGFRYKANDLVKVDGDIYICTVGHTAEAPSFTGSSKWSMWLPGGMFDQMWSGSVAYQVGDAVIYGGDAYVSKSANNINNIPSQDSTDWGLFNVGYAVSGVWNPSTTYAPGNIVTYHGMLYEAIANSTGQDPTLFTTSATYVAAGSSGTTVVLSSVTGIVPGMHVYSAGAINAGQVVSSVSTGSNSIVLSRVPNGTLTNGATISFVGVNGAYWEMSIPGRNWTYRWAPNKNYVIGDVVVWSNGTYSCTQNHVSSSTILSGYGGNRPDVDVNNVYWILLVSHARNNSLTTLGDLETYTVTTNTQTNVTTAAYTPVPIGTNTYNLRVNANVPNWQKINVIPAVYYVDANSGQDIPTYGTTWDQPWKSIKYACGIIGQGQYYSNAAAMLNANKGWMITEMYQWMLYQCANNIAPFSTSSLFDPFYTQRDAGYIIDAVIYDMQRGGNSQTVAATLRWFYYGSQTQFANNLIEAAIPYFAPSLNYLLSLMQYVVANSAPAQSYQVLNGITVGSASYVNQNTGLGLTAEAGIAAEISSLMNIPITAVTNQNTYLVPQSNSGLTAILNIRTGTYNEILPIIVPENLSIVGDELRSVTVQPATSISIYATATSALTNAVTVTSTSGLTDQMPLQFISPYVNNASTSFDANIVPGKTYYVLGSSITGTTFQLLNAPTQTFTGTTVIGSNVISNASQITNLQVGMTVTGTGIPANTTVIAVSQAISSIATVTLSANATVSGIFNTFTATGSVVTLSGGVGNMLVYAGDCLKDMWYMTNGTTMRNLSNFGLLGMLSQTDAYGIARPTGGRFTSLNPGKGPDDTSVWIIRRSPYIQNVTNFGTGCAGAVVDGNLHNGGTKAMLHNDYTQVLSDGVGVWIRGSGAISECVSVFSYYCYIGHFAEAGGRIRSTNGNSSYGTFGVVSSGYDVNEIPATGNVFNQSTQVQASVSQAFGTTNNILKLNYSNAGNGYYLPATNMLQYSNNFVASIWNSDGNVSFIKNESAPTGYTEAWLLTGAGSTPGTGYIQQSIGVNPAGAFYSNVSGITQNSAPGNGATFDITVTSTAYQAVVHSGSAGSLYVVTNTILIKGSQLGGVDGLNDCTVTVGSLTGTGILTLSSVTGTVPTGSAQNYTLSMYVYAGTSQTIDIQGVFSGNTTVVSGISYNTKTNVVTPYAGTALGNSTNAGMLPVFYGASKTLVTGWYRVWVAVNDVTGLNNTLTYKFFPQGANAPVTGTYSIIYGGQVELSGSTPAPDFYLETTSSMYTAYANYEVVGAGSGALLSGDETRSGSVFNARIVTDSAGYTGGSGYATASNTSQGGNKNSIILSNADAGLYNYIGMRVFIQSGTGAGQFGYITYYNKGSVTDANGIPSKTALVCTDEVDQISITTTTYSGTAANNLMTIASGTDISKLYVNQAVQFTPTYYSSVVTSTSVGSITVIGSVGGTTNTLQVTSTADLQLNMAVIFTGSGFNITPYYQYYIVNIIDSQNIQVSAALYGNPIQLSTVSASAGYSMNMSYANYSGYLTAAGNSTTLNVTGITSTTGVFAGTGFNLTVGQAVTITGIFSSGSIVGYAEGTTYYVIGSPTSTAFQLSATLNGSAIATTTSSGTITGITVSAASITTGNMLPNIAIQFTGIALGGITLGNTYYIQDIIDSNNFTISTQQVNLTSSTTTGGSSNTVQVSTSTLIPLNPVVFGGTIFDASLTANTTYYISSIVDSNDITLASSIYRTTATATAFTTNLIQISGSVANFVIGQPIIFSGIPSGQTFGNIVAETVYYILTTNTVTNQIVISTDKINPFTLTSATGQIFVRTCLSTAAVVLGGGSGTMSVTSTGSRLVVANSVANTGTMNSTYQTQLIGGVNSYTVYYITAINAGTSPTISVSTSLGGTPITLANGLGNMQLGASGWDNINPGTPSVSALDSTSSYYIEPRVTFTAPAWSQTTGTMATPLANGVTWQSMAYGNNYFLAIPSTGSTGAQSSNGLNWTSMVLPASVTSWSSIAFGNFYWIALGKTAANVSVAAYSNSNGAGWRTVNMPSNATWSSITYGNGRFVALASGTTSAAYTTNFGSTWTASTLPANKTWVGISYGTGLFLAVASDGTGAWSYDGSIWQATSLPASTSTLNSVTISSGGGSFSCAISPSQLVVGQTVVISGTNTGTGSVTNGTYYIYQTNGSTSFVLSSTSGTYTAISTSAGTPNGLTFTLGPSNYSSVTWGDNRFVAVQNGTGLYSAYSFNGITWYQSQSYMSATSVVYGQGRFVAVQSSGTAEYNSHAAVYWTQRTLSYGNINVIGFGFNTNNVGVFPTLAGTGGTAGSVTVISEGTRALARATVTSGTVVAVNLFETGSGYTSSPTVSFSDFNSQVTALVNARVGNGTLSNPTFVNRGTGYNTTSTVVTITGNGYADTYQTGYTLILNNLTTLPLVGSNLTIAGNSQIYKVTSATAVYGTQAPFIEANVQVSPSMTTALSPANGTAVSLRQLYSQCRLTNHDFLSIGTGNSVATNYPNVNEANAIPANETVEVNQGHVFFVSTDENGNFQVGSLFGVQQATGTVTLSATQFGVQGLQTLSLGGIAVGGSQVVVTQFSTDPTFVANSDAVIPTQRAIKSYLSGRLSQGGSNTYTGAFTAGTITVGGANFIESTVPNGSPGSVVKMKNKVYVNYNGVAGSMVVLDRFISTARNKTDTFQMVSNPAMPNGS